VTDRLLGSPWTGNRSQHWDWSHDSGRLRCGNRRHGRRSAGQISRVDLSIARGGVENLPGPDDRGAVAGGENVDARPSCESSAGRFPERRGMSDDGEDAGGGEAGWRRRPRG